MLPPTIELTKILASF